MIPDPLHRLIYPKFRTDYEVLEVLLTHLTKYSYNLQCSDVHASCLTGEQEILGSHATDKEK